MSMELDSIIVLPQFKIIIDIEVKNSSGKNMLQKASKQISTHGCLFKQRFQQLLSPGWKFVKSVCIFDSEQISIKELCNCNNCVKYILSKNDLSKNNNFKTWIQSLINDKKQFSKCEYQEDFNILLKGFNFTENKSDPLEISKQTEMKLIAKNVHIDSENEKSRDKLKMEYTKCKQVAKKITNNESLCYEISPSQVEALNSNSSRLILDGDIGTGKTYILKIKAKVYAEENPEKNIMYLNLTGGQNYQNAVTLMDVLVFDDFEKGNETEVDNIKENVEDFKNIKIVTSGDLYKETNFTDMKKALEEYLQKETYDYVFIDELSFMFTPKEGVSYCITLTDSMNALSKLFQDDYKFDSIKFESNVRNSQNIVNLSKAVSDQHFTFNFR